MSPGNRTRVKVVKNKIAPPFREVEFDIMFGEGISREGDILDLGVEDNIVEKSGAWYSYKGDRIGQGRENTKSFLKEHPEISRELEDKNSGEGRHCKEGGRAKKAGRTAAEKQA